MLFFTKCEYWLYTDKQVSIGNKIIRFYWSTMKKKTGLIVVKSFLYLKLWGSTRFYTG